MNTHKNTSPSLTGEKDISIELLRIYACIMVIWAHIQINYMVGDSLNQTSFIIKCLIGDNVPVFLLILGFYMFNSLQGADRIQKIPSVYVHKLKGFLIRVYIPTLIVSLIACFANTFIYRQQSFTELFTNPQINWDYLKTYVIDQAPMDMVGQFWYIVVYIKLLIFFPLLAFLCVNDKQYNRIRRIYMGLSYLCIILEDFGYLQNTSFLNLSDYVFDRHFLYVLLGFELALFFKQTTWQRSRQVFLGITVFLLGVGLRYGMTMYSFDLFGIASNDHFMGLECFPAFLSSAGCLMTFYSLFRGRHNRIILFLGSLTFYIYMTHGMMLRYFSDIGDQIRTATENGASNSQALLYYVEYGGVIFITSLLFGFLLKLLYENICRGIAVLYQKIRGRLPFHKSL